MAAMKKELRGQVAFVTADRAGSDSPRGRSPSRASTWLSRDAETRPVGRRRRIEAAGPGGAEALRADVRHYGEVDARSRAVARFGGARYRDQQRRRRSASRMSRRCGERGRVIETT
jgi:hypothetical protein